MKLIVTSSQNVASKNMHQLFVTEFGFKTIEGTYDNNPIYQKDDFYLVMINKDIISVEALSLCFNPEIYIVASTHTSSSGVKTFSVHAPGNFGSAELGGKAREIPQAPCHFMTNVFCFFQKHLIRSYECCFEATHHGPSTMNGPICYVEVGGSDREWNDMEACKVACRAILESSMVRSTEPAVCFGGPHYCPNFSKGYVVDNYSIGHVCAKHSVDDLTEELFVDAFAKCRPASKVALLDWKGLSAIQRDKLVGWCGKHNIEWKKLTQLRAQESN